MLKLIPMEIGFHKSYRIRFNVNDYWGKLRELAPGALSQNIFDSAWRPIMLKIMLTAGILLFCNGCQSGGEYLFRPKYDYMIVFYNQNRYDLKNVGFRYGEDFWGCGWLSSNQMAVDSFLSTPLTKDIVCEWEKAGEFHKKQFHLPRSVENKFQGTIVFFFNQDDVTMEYEMYSERVKRAGCGSLMDKYRQMSHSKD